MARIDNIVKQEMGVVKKSGYSKLLLLTLFVVVLSGGIESLYGQRFPERKMIRSGNKEYQRENYQQSEVEYRRALESNPDSYQAKCNLANTLYREERYQEAADIFTRLARDTTYIDESAHSHFNAGNALFKANKLEEALEEYKSSLRRDPADMEAKYNLAYVKKLLEKDQDQDQNDDKNDDQDKDQDQNEDQDKDKSDDKNDDKDQDGDKDKEDKDGDGDKDKQKPPPSKPEPKEGGMTQQEAERMLEAMQQNEDKTREKMNQEGAEAVSESGKNW